MTKAKKPDSFAQNPFKTLKGFCASSPPQKLPPSPVKPQEPLPQPDPDFSEEMSRFGVRQLAHDEEIALVPPRPSPPAVAIRVAETDEELFLQAFGGMQVVFQDELPEEEAALPEPSSRRMKLVQQGRLRPEATLDLHGCTRDEARTKVRFLLENAVHRGQTLVLIITGWGKSGSGEAVLRDEIVKYLRSGAPGVSEWGLAPRQLGGEGALVVFLKQNSRS